MEKKKGLFDSLPDFGLFVSLFGGGSDHGNIFPESDAEDLRNGAAEIPDKVTDARREGKKVKFVKSGKSYYWEMPDKSKIYPE